jgi:GNAT superfamily N-acetyltransferase
MVGAFEVAWTLLKMPKPDFPYYGDPEEFSLQHEYDKHGNLQVAAIQGLDKYDQKPIKYGYAKFSVADGNLIPLASYTHPSFRRGGIATDMYNHAEKITGLSVQNTDFMQSDDARSFWANREAQQ